MNLSEATFLPFSGADFAKMWASFKASPFKTDVLFEMHRRNADAMMNATHVFFDGLNSIAQRQGEVFATTLNDCGKATLGVFTDGSWEERAISQVDAARHVYVSTVAYLRDLSEMAIKTNIAAFDVLSARIDEALDEFRGLRSASMSPARIGVEAEPVVAEPVTVVEDAPAVEEPSSEEPDGTERPEPKTSPNKAGRIRKAGRRPKSRS